MKTGWRGPCPYKPTKLIRLTCPLRAADLTSSGPDAAIACFQGFPLCQRHHPTKEDLPFAGVKAVRGEASHKPSPRKRQRALGPDADTKGFLGFGYKTKMHWICRVRRYFLVHHIEHPKR